MDHQHLRLVADELAIEDPAATSPLDPDVALDEAAQGTSGTEEDLAVGTGEIDAIGHAAGFVVRDDKPFRGIDEIERRDEHRWELDPASEEDVDRSTD